MNNIVKFNKLQKFFSFTALIFIVAFNYGCFPRKMEYIDLTTNIISKIEESSQDTITTTIKDLLNINVSDRIYINYTLFHFPNGQWANEKEFLHDMKLVVKNNENLIFSDTLTSFFIINENEVYKQYIVQSENIKFSPDWYDPDIAYIA